MGARPAGPVARGRASWTRATAVIVVLCFSPACAVRTWRPTALTPESAARSMSPGRTVRIPTDRGLVTLRVVRLAYPFVEGVPEPGSSEVVFRVQHATAEVRTVEPDGSVHRTRLPHAAAWPLDSVVDRDVQLRTPEGTRLALRVRALEEGLVSGRPIACWGEGGERCTAAIVVDLSQTTRILVRGIDRRGVAGNVALVGTVALACVLVLGFFEAMSHLE
jgi:hypothetical protein